MVAVAGYADDNGITVEHNGERVTLDAGDVTEVEWVPGLGWVEP